MPAALRAFATWGLSALAPFAACHSAGRTADPPAGSSLPPAPPERLVDTSPHRAGTVTVRGVPVHYLDWGGTGEALVFIPGFGNTAHVFDDFAPRFTDRFRVVGVTRVGFGDPAPPDSGYDLASRVEHVRAVLETLGLARAHLVGHSLGGDEITAFARTYPARTGKLVYLDAAYDHVLAFQWGQAFALFDAHAPQPTAAERRSLVALRAFSRRQGETLHAPHYAFLALPDEIARRVRAFLLDASSS